MSLSDWHLAVKLADQPLAPKSILRLPETELGEYSLGGYSISFLKQLIAGKLQESVPDPELIGESLWTGDGLLLIMILSAVILLGQFVPTRYIWHCLEILCGEGNGTPLQYSCLENRMDRGAW